MQQFVFQVHELPAVIFFENKVPTIFEGIFYKKISIVVVRDTNV